VHFCRPRQDYCLQEQIVKKDLKLAQMSTSFFSVSSPEPDLKSLIVSDIVEMHDVTAKDPGLLVSILQNFFYSS
jgi:hypothetical protein